MTSEVLDLIKSIIPVASAILGAIVGAGITLIVTLINKRSEERRHIQSLIFGAGIENFKAAVSLASQAKGKREILPLDFFILNMKYLLEILQKKNLSPEEFKKAIIDKSNLLDQLAQIDELGPRSTAEKSESGDTNQNL